MLYGIYRRYSGASLHRETFPISRMRFGRIFLNALGLVKMAVARANQQAGTLPAQIELLAAASRNFPGRCIAGLKANATSLRDSP